MKIFLLSVHVLAAIVFIGPVTVTASMFPRYARALVDAPDDVRSRTAAALLHRVGRVYAILGVLVPAFGVAVAVRLGVLTDAWLLVSIALTAAAAGLLLLVVLPGQGRLLAEPLGADARRAVGRLVMATGTFNLLWVVVVVLMIARPGSTTGV